jgi:hypothetical protein
MQAYIFLFVFKVWMIKPGLHNGEEELAGVILELQDEIHPGLAQRVDVVQDQGRDDPQPVRLVGRYASLKQRGFQNRKLIKFQQKTRIGSKGFHVKI